MPKKSGCEKCKKKSKNRLTPAKLESKKQDKKIIGLVEGQGGQFPLEL